MATYGYIHEQYEHTKLVKRTMHMTEKIIGKENRRGLKRNITIGDVFKRLLTYYHKNPPPEDSGGGGYRDGP